MAMLLFPIIDRKGTRSQKQNARMRLNHLPRNVKNSAWTYS